MKQILLIAWREYRQYVFSRGFLLFLIMFPLGFFGVSAAVAIAENSKPTRYFVIYDQTDVYADDIVERLEIQHLGTVLSAWDAYVRTTRAADAAPLPAPFAPAQINTERVVAFEAAGGATAAMAQIGDSLRDGAPPFEAPRPSFIRIDLPPEAAAASTLEDVEEALRPYLLEEKLTATPEGPKPIFAALLIPAGYDGGEDGPAAQYWSRHLTDTALESRISRALNRTIKRDAYHERGIPYADIARIEGVSAPLGSFRPDRAAEEAQLGLQDRIESGLPAAMTYMLLVIIFGVGNLLLTNTIEERSNKIVEILLSSVTANQLMMGKLLGIGAVGLTMPTIFLTTGVAMSATIDTGGDESIATTIINTLLSSNFLAIYLFYFLCAYVIFAMIFLAIGAVSNSLQDAQSYMGPVMLIVFLPLPFILMVYQNPNGLVASILTWIPIYTPYAVMMRAAADPPMWEILGATALMLTFAIFLMRIMGRIFRQAILQASPPKMRDVWRLAKKERA